MGLEKNSKDRHRRSLVARGWTVLRRLNAPRDKQAQLAAAALLLLLEAVLCTLIVTQVACEAAPYDLTSILKFIP